jgi:hypothetical protein
MKTATPKAKCISVILSVLIFSFQLSAQSQLKKRKVLGVRAYSTITGSGHGSFYTPSIYVTSGRSLYSAGLVVANKNTHLCGVQGSYEYLLNGQDYYGGRRRTELVAFGAIMYRPACALSENAIALEDKENIPMLRSERFSTFESYAGVALKIRIIKNLQWANSIGMGAYYSPNLPGDLYHERSAVCLQLRTGLYLNFSKRR